jgi:hypothetical protein
VLREFGVVGSFNEGIQIQTDGMTGSIIRHHIFSYLLHETIWPIVDGDFRGKVSLIRRRTSESLYRIHETQEPPTTQNQTEQ